MGWARRTAWQGLRARRRVGDPDSRRFRPWSRSALAEGDVAEDGPRFPWQRAPVLARAIDLAAEGRRGVPRPARVEQERAGERDHVRPAGLEDRLGLAGL